MPSNSDPAYKDAFMFRLGPFPHDAISFPRYARWFTALVFFVLLDIVLPLHADSKPPDGALASFGIAQLQNDSPIDASAPSPDGKQLATLDRRSAAIWDIATGQAVNRFSFDVPDSDDQRGLAFAPDGKVLAVSDSSHIVLLRVPELTLLKKLKPKEPLDNANLLFSPDARYLASIDATCLRLFDLASDKEILHIDEVKKAHFSVDGKLLVASTWSRLCLHELPTGKARFVVPLPSPYYESDADYTKLPIDRPLAFSPDGHTIAVGMSGGNVHLLDAATGKKRARLFSTAIPDKQPERRFFHAQALTFSPDGQLLAVDAGDGFLRIWEVCTRLELHRFKGSSGNSESLVFMADGHRLMSFGEGEGMLWDLVPKDHEKAKTDPFVDLQSNDGPTAYQAVWTFADDPQAPTRLQEQIKITRLDGGPDRITRLIADLNSPRFSARETATRELTTLEESARPFLMQELEKKPALETERRIMAVLERIDGELRPNELLAMRAVRVLELHGSAAARKVLQEWSEGTPGLRLTEASRAALGRMRKVKK
jgi:WD domain, G-beta repeat